MFKAHRKTVHNNAHTHARTHTLHASMQAPMQVLLHGRSTLSHTRIRHTHPSTCTPHTHFPPPATRQRARARQCTQQCEASLSKKKRLCPSRRRVPEAKAPRCPSVLCISSPSDSFLPSGVLLFSASLLPLTVSCSGAHSFCLHLSVTHVSLNTHLRDRPRTDDNGNHFRHTRPQPHPPTRPRPVRLFAYGDVLYYQFFCALRSIINDAVSQIVTR